MSLFRLACIVIDVFMFVQYKQGTKHRPPSWSNVLFWQGCVPNMFLTHYLVSLRVHKTVSELVSLKKNKWLKNRTFVEYILFYPFTTLVCDFILRDTLRGEKLEQSLPA